MTNKDTKEVSDKQQNAALRIFSDHRDVFEAALSRLGPWHMGEKYDVLHDFLLYHLPKALHTFQPEKGDLEPWLYTIFFRYARRTMERQRKNSIIYSELYESIANMENEELFSLESSFQPNQNQKISKALSQLQDDWRKSLTLFFGNGPEAYNIRALGRSMQCSRHKALQCVVEGLAALAALLDEPGILSKQELEVCRLYLIKRLAWPQIARSLKMSENQVNLVFKNAMQKLKLQFKKP